MYRRRYMSLFQEEGPKRTCNYRWLLVFAAAFLVMTLSFVAPVQAIAASEDFVLLADTHLGQPFKPSYKETRDALYWASEFDNLKAVCVAGDLTDRGSPVSYSEWEYLCDSILDGAAHIQALGDHDTGKNGAYLEAGRSLTAAHGYKYFKQINGGSATSFTQFETANVMTIGGVRARGYHVITNSMLKQLNKRLLKTARQGKMAIVVCHYPYYDGALNMRLKLMSILRSYPNVIYVSGHKHRYSTKRQCQQVKPSCGQTPYTRSGFSAKTQYAFRSIGVDACSAYRAGNGISYADLLSISSNGRLTLKKWNLTKDRVERKWAFRQTKSSVTVKSVPTTDGYPKDTAVEYRIVFSDGKAYGGVKSGDSFTLKVGKAKKFSGIPAGVLVTVKQVSTPKGWTTPKAKNVEVGKSARMINMKTGHSSSKLRAASL